MKAGEVQMGTAAYHAERELDTIMYQDSGIYRNQQYGKANAVMLRTMYEEIPILWDQEVKYRPNFSVTDSVVNIPVIFCKSVGSQRRTVSTVLVRDQKPDDGRDVCHFQSTVY